MIIDHEALMQWAKDQDVFGLRRPIRLEIAAELRWTGKDHVYARVYLRDPRCLHDERNWIGQCECGPLAEKRIG